MIRNEEIYKQALVFRKRGFTYAEIAQLCGVHKATVARWCKHKRFSRSVAKDNAKRAAKDNAKRLALLQKAKRTEHKRQTKRIIAEAHTSFRHYKAHALFVAGLMLYRSHGDCSESGKIRFTCNDIASHLIFRRFLAEYSGLSSKNISCWLLLYASHDEKACLRAWSKGLKIPVQSFGKTQILKQHSKTLHFGTGNTIIGNTVLKGTLLTWIIALEAELQK